MTAKTASKKPMKKNTSKMTMECQKCHGKCCRYFAQPIETPDADLLTDHRSQLGSVVGQRLAISLTGHQIRTWIRGLGHGHDLVDEAFEVLVPCREIGLDVDLDDGGGSATI